MRNIGDTVFVAWAHAHCSVEKECPVCFGKCEVRIILGDDSTVAVRCHYCRSGYEPPSGTVLVYEPRCGVTEVKITGVEKDGDGFRYRFEPYVSQELGIFDYTDDARVAAEAAFPAVKEHADKAAARIPADKWSDESWSVGYHQKTIRDARKSIEWHESQVKR